MATLGLVGNTYNPLGRLGPHYERPEYRPPAPGENALDGQAANNHFQRGDRSTLSVKNTESAAKAVPDIPAGKLNLAQADALLNRTAELIQALPPSGVGQPHQRTTTSLMTPIYV